MLLFDRYQYDPQEDLLGKGGFARVYKALDKKFDRLVALKIFKDVEIAERYQLKSEIKRAITFDHPNICRYFDIHDLEVENSLGEKVYSQVCIMEYMNSGNLLQYYEKVKNCQILNKLLIDALCGISYLHKKKIIHRDIKPANILIKQTDEGIVAKIIDFGISKKTDSEASSSSSAILGSVSYMAPEQFLPKQYGINGKVSLNIDLWAFGVMLFEILSGRPLFGKPGNQMTTEEIMGKIITPELPKDIEKLEEPYREIISKCLIKNAGLRVQKADELIDMLNRQVNLSYPTVTDKTVGNPSLSAMEETMIFETGNGALKISEKFVENEETVFYGDEIISEEKDKTPESIDALSDSNVKESTENESEKGKTSYLPGIFTGIVIIGIIIFFIVKNISPSAKELEVKRIFDSIRIADSLAMVQAEQQRIADSIAQLQH